MRYGRESCHIHQNCATDAMVSQARYVAGSVDDIRNSLEWAGLEYDYGA